MLTARSELEDGRTLLVFGLSAENIRRLQEGQPIRVTQTSHGQAVPENLVVVMFAGDTEGTMEADLRKYRLIGPETVVNQKVPM
jgi:hypothetical protein